MKFSILAVSAALPLLAAAQNGTKLFSYADAFSGQFSPKRTSLQWVNADSDGTYVVTDPSSSSLVFSNIVTGENSTFVDASKLGFEYYDYSIQPSRDHVLFATNYTKQYRHSYNASYFIFDRKTETVQPLVDDQKGDIQYAAWSTTGDVIAFVRQNDLYLWQSGQVTRVTEDGGPDLFNGIPDWVYEEEIYGDRFTLWFSPDGEYLAFLRMNETGVPTYTVPYYMNGKTIAPPYPRELDIRYPKVSEKNPTVTFNLVKVGSGATNSSKPVVKEIAFDSFSPEDLIIGEVAWVAEKHENVIFRSFNRVQDQEKLVLVDVESGTTKIVRERDGTDGWIDNLLAIQYVGAISNYTGSNRNASSTAYYLDLSDHSGWTHLYLYPVHGGEPKALTSGEWEVTSIVKIDAARNLVYYLSTERDSTERHLYSVSITTGKKTALVPTDTPAYYAASFSAEGGYYILSYNGPDIPWQNLYSINSTTVPIQKINDNAALKEKLSAYKLPKISYSTIKHPSGNFSLNVREILPANFNPRKKYPILFDPYGGPGSQEVAKSFDTPAWRTYIGSDPELEYIVLTVDNRGTGLKGRAFRSTVVKQLGKLEAEDQVWVAKVWREKDYVDEDHVAIWGWSFGGYLTSKVVETDSNVFTLGVSTAPVGDWRFYDSMYTERYMKTVELNPAGYNASAVRRSSGFQNIAGNFLVQHGTGDDNVHFQHSAVMVDILTNAGVSPEKMDVQWFTDSDHSNNFHGATKFLYKQLTGKLWAEKNRKGKGGGHQWSKKHLMARTEASVPTLKVVAEEMRRFGKGKAEKRMAALKENPAREVVVMDV